MGLYEWALAAMMSREMPTYFEDTGPEKAALKMEQRKMLARAAVDAAKSVKNWPLGLRERVAALLVTGQDESGLSLRIHFGICHMYECDRGLAVSPWQLHATALQNPDDFSKLVGITPEATGMAAQAAAQALAYRWQLCRGAEDEIRGMFNAYGGRGCKENWKSGSDRAARYRRLLQVPDPVRTVSGTVLLIGDSLAEGLERPLRGRLEAEGQKLKGLWARGSTARYWRQQAPRLASANLVLVSVGTNDCMTEELRRELTRNIRAIAYSGGRIVFLMPPRGCGELTRAFKDFEVIQVPEALPLRDRVHPVLAGYESWAQVIVGHLAEKK